MLSARSLVISALAVLSLLGRDAAGQGATINYLTADDKAAGWKLLFDGKTLYGFRGLDKPDFLGAGWKIQDGSLFLPKSYEISGKRTGGDLITTATFSDFEFSFEWKLAVSASSGVVYCARAGFGTGPVGYEFQLIDDVHHPDGLKGGPIRRTGALYGVLAPSDKKRINDAGWNSGRIVVEGTHAEHWINGVKVLEYDFNSPALAQAVHASRIRTWPGFGMKMPGAIVLRDKGEEVAFRSLKIRLPSATPAVVPSGSPAPPVSGTESEHPESAPPAPRVGPTPFKSRIPIPGEP